jgi:hypothetical protein
MINSFSIRIKFCFKEIREKENFQNDKDDKKLNDNDDPQGFAYCHVFKSIEIEF